MAQNKRQNANSSQKGKSILANVQLYDEMSETQILKGLMLGDQMKLQTRDPRQQAAQDRRVLSSIRSKSELKGEPQFTISVEEAEELNSKVLSKIKKEKQHYFLYGANYDHGGRQDDPSIQRLDNQKSSVGNISQSPFSSRIEFNKKSEIFSPLAEQRTSPQIITANSRSLLPATLSPRPSAYPSSQMKSIYNIFSQTTSNKNNGDSSKKGLKFFASKYQELISYNKQAGGNVLQQIAGSLDLENDVHLNNQLINFKDNFSRIKNGSKVAMKDKRHSIMAATNANIMSDRNIMISPKQSTRNIQFDAGNRFQVNNTYDEKQVELQKMNKTSLASLGYRRSNAFLNQSPSNAIPFRRPDISTLQKNTTSEWGSSAILTIDQEKKKSATQDQIQKAIRMVRQKLNVHDPNLDAKGGDPNIRLTLPRDISIAQFDDTGIFKGFPAGSQTNLNNTAPEPAVKPTMQSIYESVDLNDDTNSQSLSGGCLDDFVGEYRDSELGFATKQAGPWRKNAMNNTVQFGMDDPGTKGQVLSILKHQLVKKRKNEYVVKLKNNQIGGEARQSPDSVFVVQHMSNRQKNAVPKNKSVSPNAVPATNLWEEHLKSQVDTSIFRSKEYSNLHRTKDNLNELGEITVREQNEEEAFESKYVQGMYQDLARRRADKITVADGILVTGATTLPAISSSKSPGHSTANWKKSLRSQNTTASKKAQKQKEQEEERLRRFHSQLNYSIKIRKQRAMQLREQFQESQQKFAQQNPKLSPQRLSLETLKDIEKKKMAELKEKQVLFKDITEDQKVISLILINSDGKETENSILQSHWNLVRNAGDQTELIEYLKFLTGVSKNKKSVGARLLAKVPAMMSHQKDWKAVFEDYVVKDANIMQEIADKLESRVKMIHVQKEGHTPSTEERYKDDPRFIYFQKCLKHEEPALPLLEYVHNKTLCLQSYTLSIGQCKALADAFANFTDANINRVIFDNCGIDDLEFSNLLKGIQTLKDFKKIIYRRNQFREKSLEELVPIIHKKVPNHLEELRIQDCQMPPDITRQLVTELWEKCYIQKLALVGVKFSEETWDTFVDYVDNSNVLWEVDISWAGIRPGQVEALMRVLSTNFQLRYINLSQIQLFRAETAIEKQQEELPEDIQRIMDCLIRFIKRNTKLFHVDLTSCGLCLKMLYQFGAALRRSKSLRSLHLSDNPALSDPYQSKQLIDWLVTRAHCIRTTQYNVIDFQQLPSNYEFSQGLMGGRRSSLEESAASDHSPAGSRLSSFNDPATTAGKLQDKASRMKEQMQSKILGNIKTQKASLQFQDRIASKLRGDVMKERMHSQFLGLSYQTSVVIEKGSAQQFIQQKTLVDKLREKSAKFSKEKFIQNLGQQNEDDDDSKQTQRIKDRLDEAAKLKYLIKLKSMEQHVTQNVNHDRRPLIISRVLGHKEDMPGMGQWRIITKQPTGQNECWICDNKIYSLIFWNEIVGGLEIRKFAQNDREFLVAKIKEFNPDDRELEKAKCGHGCPFIYGQFTNWKPAKMQDIREFCDRINKDKPDIFQDMKNNDIIPWKYNTAEELPRFLKEEYEREVKYYFDGYRRIWKDIVQKYMKYQKPNLVNAGFKDLVDRVDVPLYVYATFMTSGKQHYVVRHEKPNAEVKWYPANCIVKHRAEPIFKFRKKLNKIIIEPKFSKGSSVFSAWRQDDTSVVKKCLEHDFRFWKGPRFIRDKDDYKATCQAIKKHFDFLKAQHLQLASSSTFPCTMINEWTNYAKFRAKFVDGKNIIPSTLDRLFIAANVELEEQDNNPDKALIRFEFIELLVRVAKEKYWKDGAAKTVCEAFEMLMQRDVIPAGSPREEWHGFREQQLYTLDVNRVFHANLDGIAKVRAIYLSPAQRKLTLEHIYDLFAVRSELALTEKETKFCYGMSKMTVANENDELDRRYFKMEPVELLEMIGRVADLKFRGSELEDQPLHTKVEYVLDDLFAAVPGLKRKNVNYELEEETESDQDY